MLIMWLVIQKWTYPLSWVLILINKGLKSNYMKIKIILLLILVQFGLKFFTHQVILFRVLASNLWIININKFVYLQEILFFWERLGDLI